MEITTTNLAVLKANEIPFDIMLKTNEYPIAPLVFGENMAEKNSYRIRIIVYIPFEVKTTPKFIIENNGKASAVITEGGQEIMARSFIVEYDYSSKITPKTYTLWSITYEYNIGDMEPVDYVMTRLRDFDPKTSRGTVTTVQLP